MRGRPFPFGKTSLGVGAALLVGSPFAVRAALRFDDAFFYVVALYFGGMTVTAVLAILAFATTSRRPVAPPAVAARADAPPSPWPAQGGAAPPLAPVMAAPEGATGERVAATAGLALAGVGCSAIAGVLLVALVILAVAAYIVFEIVKAIFATH